jgi:integrase
MPAIERVFARHGSWHYDFGRDESGRRKSVRLVRFDDGEAALYKALAKIISPAAPTIRDLLTSFKMHGMGELAVRTQLDYCNYIDRQLDRTFGDMEPDELETADCAKYLKLRKNAGAGVIANKEMACLSSAFQYGLSEGLCTRNPCRGIRRNKTRARTRYVRDDEYLLYFNASPEHLQDLLAGIYLMELRPGEARNLLRSSITPKGVLIEETKTDKMKLVEWSKDGALQFFMTRATSRCQSPFVFTNSRGEKWTETGMHSALATVRATLPEGSPRWTFHDIRAKGESDHKDGGHGLLALYKRAKIVSAVR